MNRLRNGITMVQPEKRIKGEKWTQAEMETLASLCLTHGRNGILSKETNKVTTTKKNMQWITVQSVFNSMHPSRDKSAMVARFKYILMYLRKDKARKRLSTMKTGDGKCAAVEEKMPFQMTGPMLKLADILGVSASGLDGVGSDAQNCLALTDTLPNYSSEATENGSLDVMRDMPCSLPQTINDNCENLRNDGTRTENTESENQAEASVTQVESSGTESESITPNNMDLPAASFSGRLQFSPSIQKRERKRKVSSAFLQNASEGVLDIRKEYLVEKEQREKEKHAAEMHFKNVVLEAKLEEMRQIASDRQAERKRRAELHAMEIRHKEAIFNHQIQLMIAARNALACSCSSRDIALRSVISLAKENNSCMSAVGNSLDETLTSSTSVEEFEATESFIKMEYNPIP